MSEVMGEFEEAGFPLYEGALHPGESYLGNGKIPASDRSFVEHEVAHAIDFHLEGTLGKRMKLIGWGMEVSQVSTQFGLFDEPRTMQATERECRVFGMEWHIYNALPKREYVGVSSPVIKGFHSWVHSKAEILHQFMPDWIFPLDSSSEDRLKVRHDLIKQSAANWTLDALREAWVEPRKMLASYRASEPTGMVALPPIREM